MLIVVDVDGIEDVIEDILNLLIIDVGKIIENININVKESYSNWWRGWFAKPLGH